MSLVPLDYGSSSEDEEGVLEKQTQDRASLESSDQTKSKPALFSTLPPPKSTPGSSLFGALPPPKRSNVTTGTSESKRPEKRQKVQIFVDVPPTDFSSDSNDGPHNEEAGKASSALKGLFSNLPPPKRAINVSADVERPKAAEPGAQPASQDDSDHTEPQGVEAAPEHVESTDEPEIAPEDFFTLPDPNAEYPIEDYSEPVGPSKAGHTAPTPAQYSVSAQYAYPPPGASDSYYQQFYQDPNDIYSYTTAEPFAAGPEIPEEVLKAFGTRDRKLEDNIQYKEINQSQLIDNNAWQMQAARQLSMDQSTGLTGSTLKPSSGQKRKHNIMSLAFEAKQREAALKEAAANRMANKAARRAKYGF